jgi:hypothetical protein
MKTAISLLIVLAIVFGCATIPQDKPQTSMQCFESKINPFRMAQWKSVLNYRGVLFVKNPTIGQYPDYVSIICDPFGRLIHYAYLDGRNIVAYKFNHKKRCYLKHTIKARTAVLLKKILLKCRNGYEVYNEPKITEAKA